FGGIAAQGKLKNMGIRLAPKGKVLKPAGIITDGPFVEIRELLAGLIIVKADDLEDATTLAHGCPALDFGGSVEIRPLHEHQHRIFSD
ncbi:MAG TPA: YciI family protein, partial [Mucilaginibacter sp.]